MPVVRSPRSPHFCPPVRAGFRRLGLVGVKALVLSAILSGCGASAERATPAVNVTREGSWGTARTEALASITRDAGVAEMEYAAPMEAVGEEYSGDGDNLKTLPAPPPAPPPQDGSAAASSKAGAGPSTTPRPAPASDDPDRKQPVLIYRADFTMSVYEVQKSLDALESLAKSSHGFLSRRDDQSITLRIPAERFADVLSQIEKIGDVLHRDVVSEDVTAEYRDLEIQLENALVLRTRLEKILEKATKVEEALEVERELARLTTDIERIKGRLKLLTDLSRYSTVTVRFQARSSEVLQKGPFVLPLPWLNNLGLGRLRSL